MKKISKISCFIVAIFIGLTPKIEAQDDVGLRNLEVNKILLKTKKPPQRKSGTSLPLPFFDDFSSRRSPFPNPNLWQDHMVFINSSFPLFPPTIGVATFDALDANGRLYEHATPYPFGADTLTSQPIRLDSIFDGNPRKSFDIIGDKTIIGSADTIFFSFYYQPGGGFGTVMDGTLRGQRPKKDDLLILEFRNGFTEQWIEIWNTEGQSLEQFCPLCVRDTMNDGRKINDWEKEFFKHVVISVTSDTFLYDGFQFRFRNFSSLDQNQNNEPSYQSSGGQWHIDYVRLDVYPSGYTSFLSDIAFVEQGKNVLKDFQAMPFKQYQGQADLVTEIPLLFRNLDRVDQQINYSFQITGPSYFWDTTSANPDVYPFSTHGFNNTFGAGIYAYQRNFRIPHLRGTFDIQHVLKLSGTDINALNDTMIQTVHLDNYYAYDDGTPEMGFGFLGTGVANEFAYRFPLRVPDTLIGVQIWFNHTRANMSRAFFNPAVWTTENDTPSRQPIYIGPDVLPVYDDAIGFFTYWLDEPVLLNSGDFFVGFQQYNNIFLNIGFDQNNNAENRMLRRVNNNRWDTLLYQGSVMIRPVFGTRDATRICDRDFGFDEIEKIKVSPNPSDGFVCVESPEHVVNSYEIYDLIGRKLLQKTIRDTQFSINLPEKSGVYILILHTENGVVTKKIIRQ